MRGARSVHAADLDGDTDVDVMGVFEVDNKIVWFENLGDGTFEPEQVITDEVQMPRSVNCADVDGDGVVEINDAELAAKVKKLEDPNNF